MGSKDEKVLGLFLAAVLTFTPGCMFDNNSHKHIDRDRDGYCDVDGAAMGGSSTGSGTRSFYSSQGESASSSTDGSSGHISTASTPKGGIGSHSSGSGG